MPGHCNNVTFLLWWSAKACDRPNPIPLHSITTLTQPHPPYGADAFERCVTLHMLQSETTEIRLIRPRNRIDSIYRPFFRDLFGHFQRGVFRSGVRTTARHVRFPLMRSILTAGCLVILAVPALGQVPIPRDGNRPCPHGYVGSGSFCSPISDRSRAAIPKPRGGVCPHGWTASGSACISTR